MNGDEHIEGPDPTAGRRAFLKRMAALAFAAPVISSFALDSAAFAGPSNHDDKNKKPCPPPNQHGQNQTQKPPPNQYGQNQTEQIPPGQILKPPPNQYGQNQTGKPCGPPNQYGQNQTKITKYSRHG